MSSVIEGEQVAIGCTVEGGYPDNSNVSITCAGLPVETGMFVFTREVNTTHCLCEADHLSGCYFQQTDLIVNILCKLLI